MRFYKGSLTRRLILDTSIDNELEESIVIQLRVRYVDEKLMCEVDYLRRPPGFIFSGIF
jgi:hypothetical protein